MIQINVSNFYSRVCRIKTVLIAKEAQIEFFVNKRMWQIWHMWLWNYVKKQLNWNVTCWKKLCINVRCKVTNKMSSATSFNIITSNMFYRDLPYLPHRFIYEKLQCDIIVHRCIHAREQFCVISTTAIWGGHSGWLVTHASFKIKFIFSAFGKEQHFWHLIRHRPAHNTQQC